MSYGRLTPIYKLPTPSIGDVVTGSDEKRFADIIDCQLFGAVRSHSGGHGCIRTGTWSLQTDGGSNYTALLVQTPSQGKPVFEGFINQIYTYTLNGLSWGSLAASTTYYLGVRLVENSNSSSLQYKDVQTFTNTTGIVPNDGLLIAVLTIDGSGNGTFNESTLTTARVNIPIWGNHISNNQNPHGGLLNQDQLVVSGLDVLSYLNYQNLHVNNLIVSGTTIISGNITVLGQLILSGTTKVQGNITYNLLQTQNLDVPGNFIVSSLLVSSGMDVYPSPIFRNNIRMASGITIDAFDPSQAVPLLDGSNADHLHGHILGSLAVGVKPIYFSPDYANSVISGHTNSGTFINRRLYNLNLYEWFAVQSGVAVSPVLRTTLPQDFDRLDRISVTHAVGLTGTLSGNKIEIQAFDKDNTQLTVSSNGLLQSTQVTSTDLTLSGGNLVGNNPITITYRMNGSSGTPTFLGDTTLYYVPIHGEKIQFDWNQQGSPVAATRHLDGLRIAPADLRVQSVTGSQQIALSGDTIFGFNVSNAGTEPSTIFTSTQKARINFSTSGASYKSVMLVPTENLNITKGQLISCTSDLIASGSTTLSTSLICFRV